ncbi:hypothetical protein PT974_07467 [Cladobotryum mycophilum]|uniref:Uncharacterized protein n=1 Tax=Cladobotryum mycophilum TaxID=491253 RepID=A0ABR0SPE3_9HYPO
MKSTLLVSLLFLLPSFVLAQDPNCGEDPDCRNNPDCDGDPTCHKDPAVNVTGTYFDYEEVRLHVSSRHTYLAQIEKVYFYHPSAMYENERYTKYLPFGTVISTVKDISEKRATLLAGLNPDQEDEASPVFQVVNPTTNGSTPIWTSKDKNMHISRPICETEYVSLGDAFFQEDRGHNYTLWCVRRDYAMRAKVGAKASWTIDGGDGTKVNFWEVLPANHVQGSEYVPLYTSTFRAVVGDEAPDFEDLWTLAVPIERNFPQFETNPPKLEYDKMPLKGTLFPAEPQGVAPLPFTNFFPATHKMILKHIDEPFGKVEKTIAWYLQDYIRNEGKVERKNSTSITYGFSSEKSKSMEHQAGVSVTASTGIGFFETSVSLNYQFTTGSSTTFSEYNSTTETREWTVQPESITAIFTEYPEVKVSHLDGTEIYKVSGPAYNSVATQDIPYP